MRTRAVLLALALTIWGAIAAVPTAADVGGFRTLHSFTGYAGRYPNGSLIASNGMLYGTTYGGGDEPAGSGTVFSLSLGGVERVLYAFKGKPDADYPVSGLVEIDGKFYGNALGGRVGNGRYGCGTVFEVTATGAERVLYAFKCENDGAVPRGNLLVANGRLYGTTVAGGSHGAGTLFELSLSGVKRTIYDFKGSPDCSMPDGGVIAFDGNLYGTSSMGGANGAGCIFEVAPSGAERVVHTFQSGKNRPFGPDGALTAVDGKLYGSTQFGGRGNYSVGNGTIFEVALPGTLRTVYEFQSSSDGFGPTGPLVAMNGDLYGTTVNGGYVDGPGLGTVFQVRLEGKHRRLHVFSGADGYFPLGGLLALGGKLYGTTSQGGASKDDRGTAFVITP